MKIYVVIKDHTRNSDDDDELYPKLVMAFLSQEKAISYLYDLEHYMSEDGLYYYIDEVDIADFHETRAA